MLAQETLPGSLLLAFSERLNVGNRGSAVVTISYHQLCGHPHRMEQPRTGVRGKLRQSPTSYVWRCEVKGYEIRRDEAG